MITPDGMAYGVGALKRSESKAFGLEHASHGWRFPMAQPGWAALNIPRLDIRDNSITWYAGPQGQYHVVL